jgi:ParB-like chromosome segregation protein Spo0J
LDDLEDRLDADLSQGPPSLAQKVISDLFSKRHADAQLSAQNEELLRKRKEAEESERQRQKQSEQEFERAVQNYVKKAMIPGTNSGQNMQNERTKAKPVVLTAGF